MMRRSRRAMVGSSSSGSRTALTSPTMGSSSSRISPGGGSRGCFAGGADKTPHPSTRGPLAPVTDAGWTLPLELPDIKRILPHRHPFLLLDRIIELEEDRRVVGIKNVASDERYF